MLIPITKTDKNQAAPCITLGKKTTGRQLNGSQSDIRRVKKKSYSPNDIER